MEKCGRCKETADCRRRRGSRNIEEVALEEGMIGHRGRGELGLHETRTEPAAKLFQRPLVLLEGSRSNGCDEQVGE